ncbi:MAG: M3 family metallopeptidase, partial [Rikenellaceae bacterium]
IKLSHFTPAFVESMKIHKLEIDSIVNNTEAPTFENTILPLNNSGKLLDRTSRIFSILKANMSNDSLMAISKEITPLLSAHYDEINLNEKLFSKIKTVYDSRDSLTDSLARRTVEKYYDEYVRSGANLNDEQKKEMMKINSDMAMASLAFGENLLKDTKDFKLIIDNKKDLAGLPEGVVAAAAGDAKAAGLGGKWIFTVDKPSMLPFLTYSDKRDLREKIYKAYYNRGGNGNANDNRVVANKILNLSLAKAKLLGFKSYAEYVISENMAKDPKNVYKLMLELWKPALAQAKTELKELQTLADKEGKGVKVEAWDWWYYSEKLRKEKFDIDEETIKPYLSVDKVRDGMFYVSNKLYGIKLEKRNDIQVYHPDVEVYEVKGSDGKHLAIIYLDYFPRESKEGGAWCEELRSYDYNNGKEILPLITISGNFTKPVDGKPALLSWDDTETMFHEYGHALHSIFSRGRYGKVSGTIPMDMVELPSQIMENWASEPEVMRIYAKNYLTGEVIPDALIAKINASSKFNQGWATTEHVAAALLDLDHYTRTEIDTTIDVVAFEKASMEKYGLIKQIYPRYRTTFYKHIFYDGYSSGYYVYTWAAVLDSDAFEAFKEAGDIYSPEVAAKFRKYILAEGGQDEGMVQYEKFRGKAPSVVPLMRKRGFVK